MQRRVVRRRGESGRGVVVALVGGVMDRAAQNRGERDLMIGIEPMINADAAIAAKTLVAQKFSEPDFRVTVRKTAARQPDGQVGIRAQGMANAQLGIDI